MNSDFFKFPSTPHLLRLGTTPLRDDKVMSEAEALSFLREDIIVEEKVDGANIGISFDRAGCLIVQNRGSILHPSGQKDQFAPLWPWLESIQDALVELLADRLILFGEWCYALHSIHYTRLPHYFLAFDVYDREAGLFFGCDRRNALAAAAGIHVVPQIAKGRFTVSSIRQCLGTSRFYDGPAEGLYLRNERDGWLQARAKIISPEFLQGMGEHWSRRPMTANRSLSRRT